MIAGRSRAGALLLLLMSAARVARGHELAQTQVAIAVDAQRNYQIDLCTDPQALLLKLQTWNGAAHPDLATPTRRETRVGDPGAATPTRWETRVGNPSGGQPTPDASVAALHGQIEALAPTLFSAVRLTTDGSRMTPQLTRVSGVVDCGVGAAPGAQRIVLRLEGQLPRTARSMTWSYALMYGTYPLTVRLNGHEAATEWVEGNQSSSAIDLAALRGPKSHVTTARRYLALGFTHILPNGLDHILFVIGIFLLSARLRIVLAQVTAFTVAHSITLGLTMYGVLAVRPVFVEPLIALSIAYVAIENLFTSSLKPWRLALVFAFGLLHGLGFAGILTELGLPRERFITALASFNVGVEAGQVAVIAVALLLVAQWRSAEVYRPRIVIPASLAISAAGLYWTVVRVQFYLHT